MKVLPQHPGPVVISGYESALHKEMLEDRGWNEMKVRTMTKAEQHGKK